jgi:hypothetical protein
MVCPGKIAVSHSHAVHISRCAFQDTRKHLVYRFVVLHFQIRKGVQCRQLGRQHSRHLERTRIYELMSNLKGIEVQVFTPTGWNRHIEAILLHCCTGFIDLFRSTFGKFWILPRIESRDHCILNRRKNALSSSLGLQRQGRLLPTFRVPNLKGGRGADESPSPDQNGKPHGLR